MPNRVHIILVLSEEDGMRWTFGSASPLYRLRQYKSTNQRLPLAGSAMAWLRQLRSRPDGFQHVIEHLPRIPACLRAIAGELLTARTADNGFGLA